MVEIKLFINSLLLLHFASLFLHEKQPDENFLNTEIKKKIKEFKSEVNFCKASSFFMKKNWDSTMVYSMKELSNTDNLELVDYCHYFKGISFKRKGCICSYSPAFFRYLQDV